MTQCRVKVRIHPILFQGKLKARVRNAQASPLRECHSSPGYESRLEKHLPARPRGCPRPQCSPNAARPTTVFTTSQLRSPPLQPPSPSTSPCVRYTSGRADQWHRRWQSILGNVVVNSKRVSGSNCVTSRYGSGLGAAAAILSFSTK